MTLGKFNLRWIFGVIPHRESDQSNDLVAPNMQWIDQEVVCSPSTQAAEFFSVCGTPVAEQRLAVNST